MEGFSHFVYSTNQEPFKRSPDGKIIIRFEDNHKPEVQRTTTSIKAVSTSGQSSRAYRIGINYYPTELYAASGQTSPSWIIVQNTDLSVSSQSVEDWIIQKPTKEEREYAHETWGDILRSHASPHERAKALAKAIIDSLEAHRGIPSDRMQTTPFEQYRRAVSGVDHVWCGNFAQIFSYACNALGIPARSIGMSRLWSSGERYNLLMAEGHGTTEIFDSKLNSWVWIDLTFNILGAYLDGQGPINMAELHAYLNDTNRIKGLVLVEYDPKTRTEGTIPVLESAKRDALLNYFKRDQEFRYTRWDEE
jgi:hypothetical protein